MKILADAALPHIHAWFQSLFQITLYHTQDELPSLLKAQDILICRSTLKVTNTLLANTSIRWVATASSGVEHVSQDLNITLFDAKGCNACAVADYVVATLAYLSKHHYALGEKAGVVGCGHVGGEVQKRLQTMGFKTICYDPLKEAHDPTFRSCAIDALATCTLLCIHPNWHDTEPYPSVNMINSAFLQRLQPGTILINASRGGIVDENALLKTSVPLVYCTDVYLNEPAPNPALIEHATLCTPHIAGHSLEAKNAAVAILSQKLHQHFGWPMPHVERPIPIKHEARSGESWQDQVLSLYNPHLETEQLKKSSDKTKTFLTLRRTHTHRHDFVYRLCPNSRHLLIIC